MNENKKQIKQELLIEYLSEYESLTILRNQFNDNLKNGYFLLSKSKYSMGQKSCGELQYPAEMKPTFAISIELNEYSYENSKNDTFLSIHYNEKQPTTTTTIISSDSNNKQKQQQNTDSSTTRRRNIASKESKQQEPIVTTNKNGVTTMGSLESLLRNSDINNNSDSDSNTDSDDTDDDDSDTENNSSLTEEEKEKAFQEKVKKQLQKKKLKANKLIIKKDPIYWFGISTPSSLKQSQSYFKQATKQSIEISNKLIKLNIIYKKYCEQDTNNITTQKE